MIAIYSKPECRQCLMTYLVLDRKGIPFVVVDVTESAAALSYITDELGYSAAPVVVVDEHNHWTGFRPDLIDAIEHVDLSQHYRDGQFWTVCSCGAELEGRDPDEADAAHMDHAHPGE